MFGALRLFLALMVVANHILYIGYIGHFAVFGFYSLSGYLMTLVVNKSYGFGLRGFLRFWCNRSLRLLPAYWFSITLTVALIYFTGQDFVYRFNSSMQLPQNAQEWLANIFIAFWAMNPAEVTPRLCGPTWAITVELVFYLAISLGISKNLRISLAWFIFSVAYHTISIYQGWGYDSRYFPIPAASLPFSAGSLIYHLKDKESALITCIMKYRLLGFLLFTCSVFAFVLYHPPHEKGVWLATEFYISFFFIWCFLFACAKSKKRFPYLSEKQDSLLGSFSYPVYLLHFQAWILGSYIFADYSGKTVLTGVAATLVMLCWIAIYCIEKPFEKTRSMIRGRGEEKISLEIPLANLSSDR